MRTDEERSLRTALFEHLAGESILADREAYGELSRAQAQAQGRLQVRLTAEIKARSLDELTGAPNALASVALNAWQWDRVLPFEPDWWTDQGFGTRMLKCGDVAIANVNFWPSAHAAVINYVLFWNTVPTWPGNC